MICIQAYPAIYSWMTYPLTALLEITWEQVKAEEERRRRAGKRLKLDVGVVDVVSCAERALNYMHTGNPAVIKTTVMNVLWIGRAIVDDGLPSFSPAVVNFRGSRELVTVEHGKWPYDDVIRMPKSAAERGLKFRYGDMAVGVSDVLFVFDSALKGGQRRENDGYMDGSRMTGTRR